MLSKNKIIIFSLVAIGIILILISSFSGQKPVQSTYEQYICDLEKKIEDFLKEVDGIKNADVIITLESYDSEDLSGNLMSQPSTETKIPRVRGVAVACTNGNDYNVKVEVSEIISKYLGISSNRIKIVALD